MFQHTASTTNQKKRRVCRRGQSPSQVDVTQACARTRPLLTYHKPRLFIMDQSPITQQRADFSTYWCSSPLSCDPMRVCPDPDANSTNSRANIIKESSESHCIRTGSFKADWLHQSQSTILSTSFTAVEEPASSTFNCTHDLKAAQTHTNKATQIQTTPTIRRRRQQRADMDMCASQSGVLSPSTEDSTEDVFTPNRTNLHQKKTQFPVHRRNGESVYNINNIVIPTSLAASTTVEKLQYKDIPTPSWRVVEFSPLLKNEEEKNINKVETLSDEVFIRRHQRYERREKLSWSSWEKGRRHTHSARSSSSTDEPTSWTFSRATDTPQDSMKEREPQPPWERREFPLSKTEEDTLRCEEDTVKEEDEPCSKNERMDSHSSFKKSLCPLGCAHTPPPAGNTRSNKRRGTSNTI